MAVNDKKALLAVAEPVLEQAAAKHVTPQELLETVGVKQVFANAETFYKPETQVLSWGEYAVDVIVNTARDIKYIKEPGVIKLKTVTESTINYNWNISLDAALGVMLTTIMMPFATSGKVYDLAADESRPVKTGAEVITSASSRYAINLLRPSSPSISEEAGLNVGAAISVPKLLNPFNYLVAGLNLIKVGAAIAIDKLTFNHAYARPTNEKTNFISRALKAVVAFPTNLALTAVKPFAELHKLPPIASEIREQEERRFTEFTKSDYYKESQAQIEGMNKETKATHIEGSMLEAAKHLCVEPNAVKTSLNATVDLYHQENQAHAEDLQNKAQHSSTKGVAASSVINPENEESTETAKDSVAADHKSHL